MPTLLLRFPGRRYHATPWGHHVNEGLVEWPPSPWRLLRALLSVGYTTLGWPATMDTPWHSRPPAPARELFELLAATPPLYRLPPASGTHSRHYMPMGEFQRGTERTTLVFDTWAQIDVGELAVIWPIELTDDQTRLMHELAQRLNYLGRSESWVQARVATPGEAASIVPDCQPCGDLAPPGPGWEQVALLAPLAPADYAAWLDASLTRELNALPPPSGHGKAQAKAQAAIDAVRAMFPADTLACLQVDTSWLRQFGWSQPPGTQRLLYWRRSDALRAPAKVARAAQAEAQTPAAHAVLLSMASQTLNDHALPSVTRTLPQAELLHRQVLAAFGKLGTDRHSAVLSGCDAQRLPLGGAHRHAHMLPLDLDSDGHLDHLLVWAADGLPDPELSALRRVRSTFTKDGVGALRLAWAGAGDLTDFAALPLPQGEAMRRTLGPASQWLSATPFVPPRHLKLRGAHTLHGQVQAELASRGLPAAASIEWLDPQHHELARRLRHHLRVRRFGPAPAADIGFALRLNFDVQLPGPLCLGYGSHFGLGRFESETS